MSIRSTELKKVRAHWQALTGRPLNIVEEVELDNLLKTMRDTEIIAGMDIVKKGFQWNKNGDGAGPYSDSSIKQCFDRLKGRCYVEKLAKNNPDIGDIYYIRGILANRTLKYLPPNRWARRMSREGDVHAERAYHMAHYPP
jgi:hypothetical protein